MASLTVRNPYRDRLETRLYQLGQKGLKPSDAFIQRGRELGQNVFLKLQKHSRRFSVAEVRFAGSIGKKADVVEPDLDLVIVVNNCIPPFGEVLDDFEGLLKLHQEELKIREGSIQRKTSFSIQFVFINGIEVDILPAANLSRENILARLEANPEHYYRFISSLVQTQLKFMTSHSSSFLHIVVRLSKFWFKSLSLGEKWINGASTVMELIGIAAAEKEEAKPGRSSVLSAFMDVLEMVRRLTRLKLAYALDADGDWAQVPEEKLNLRNSSNLVPRVVGTEEILYRGCFIIEPANPYNNLLGGYDSLEPLERLMQYAFISLQRMKSLLAGRFEEFGPLDMVQLFDPFPTCLVDIPEFLPGIPDVIQICYEETYPYISCGMTVRDKEPMQRKPVRLVVEALRRNLLTMVNSTLKGSGEEATLKDLKKVVRKMISRNLKVSIKDRYDEVEMDVTLAIPFILEGEIQAVTLGMDWGTIRGGRRIAFQNDD